jgi:hypothetical protein
MTVIQHPTIAARDAYAARGGWLSERAAVAITYHARFGQDRHAGYERLTVLAGNRANFDAVAKSRITRFEEAIKGPLKAANRPTPALCRERVSTHFHAFQFLTKQAGAGRT